MFEAPVIQELSGGRLHLSHGPIDVVLKADGPPAAVAPAHAAAVTRFPDILGELCAELDTLRMPVGGGAGPSPRSPVGRRMAVACRPFGYRFVTPMAAVAGAVADELMAVMRAAAPIARGYVNNGGDIAVYCAPGARLDIAMAGDFTEGALPALNGSLRVAHEDGVGGIATSGARGRSLSMGIADSVTVAAADAATADAAATLIANAVVCDGAPVERRPASALDPDSDLGRRPVTVAVGRLSRGMIAEALASGLAEARLLYERGAILGAALGLQGETVALPDRHRAGYPSLPKGRGGVLAGRDTKVGKLARGHEPAPAEQRYGGVS